MKYFICTNSKIMVWFHFLFHKECNQWLWLWRAFWQTMHWIDLFYFTIAIHVRPLLDQCSNLDIMSDCMLNRTLTAGLRLVKYYWTMLWVWFEKFWNPAICNGPTPWLFILTKDHCWLHICHTVFCLRNCPPRLSV